METNEFQIKWKRTKFRKGKDLITRLLGYSALVILFAVLISIFAYILRGGATAVTWKILTTNGNTTTGGIANAIIGTWLLVGMGLLFSLPTGLFGAIYLAQKTSSKKITGISRLFTDILTSVPSIVVGLFGYLIFVIEFRFGYSLIAGGIALGIMMLPYVMRISEESFKSIPKEQIENAYALGANEINVAFKIYLPQASRGIFAGVLLAVSIAAGETAQLLYTVGFNNALPTSLVNSQVAYLTYVVWAGINQPSAYSHNLAFISAMILILSVTLLIFVSKYEREIISFSHKISKRLSGKKNKKIKN